MILHADPIPDVLVIGDGLIGLACAAATAERGLRVRVVGMMLPGAASLAAAGLLAPSIEHGDGKPNGFGVAARDRYPSYVAWLRDRTGIDVPLSRSGIIQLAVNAAGIRGLQRSMGAAARWIDAAELAELEPSLSHGLGGVFNEHDGWVDNEVLFQALRTFVEAHPRVALTPDHITRIDLADDVAAIGHGGTRYPTARLVVAAGAWSTGLAGLPRVLPIEPVRGQMLAYAAVTVSRAVYGPTGYVVPRADGRTLVGATMERVGFDPTTTADGIAKLERTAAEILPTLAQARPVQAWAGIRPISADLQPILGTDPDDPRLVYATGHSRNGVLMTPLPADCVAALVTGDSPPADLTDFSPDRFDRPSPTGG